MRRAADRAPRHRVQPARAAAAPRREVHRWAAISSATAIVGVSAFGALAVTSDAPSAAQAAGRTTVPSTLGAQAAPLAPVADEITSTIAAARPTITGGLSTAQAPFTGGTQVTVTGERLDRITQVAVGGAPAPIVEASADHVTFAVPATADTALGAVAVTFADAAGAAPDVETDASSSAASVASAADPANVTAVADAPGTLTLTYTSDPGIDAQLAYVLTYWSSYNTAEFPVISGYDCANFASQSLLARGWTMDAGWSLDRATGAMSPSWASSTALRDYLRTRTDRATELADAQRDQVKVGDIAQFDWDDSGDRDHTAVVTRVERSEAGTKVWVGGHTKDADYWDVDTALATGGGSVSYFSIR
ncbi:amidase domain-containing protein [Agromyces aerolatus]|uniref:amidase domain-containing protein n=1 Tax=Agromyces sp. LY-1074 TaxID=3074080 RepID=UPI0028562359|nr:MULTISPECIES: amidase domain-containing protein [unclassified Agromyces]MDR5700527.1 amidase domain-containing protein [Agromyces sp. LY-1074]MDR5707048.1 amidase domain-containing protein [Agromyces sp. LY-1358]